MAGDVSQMHWDPWMALEDNTMKKLSKELLNPTLTQQEINCQ